MDTYRPKTIFQDLNDLRLLFPILMDNIKNVEFLTKKLENGREEENRS